MKLIFAQGNPGKPYEKSRHNVGFLLIDALAEAYEASWSEKTKFRAYIAEVKIRGEKVLLVKPTSYYNLTGEVLRTLVDFYKLNATQDILVIHDDLSLPFGTIRVREKGSDAGNNGIKNINAHIGEQYTRVRVGIWSEMRDVMGDADFVLASLSKDEYSTLEAAIYPHILRIIDNFIAGTLEPTSMSLSLN